MVLGRLRIADFFAGTGGSVRGRLITDAKDRYYAAEYTWAETVGLPGYISVKRRSGTGNTVVLPTSLELDESLVALFGLYSGDGAKGSEHPADHQRVLPPISFSQSEPHLVKFALSQLRRIFGNSVMFTFSYGEDSAYFLAGVGAQMLQDYYGGTTPETPPLRVVRPELNERDTAYLHERRTWQISAEDDLAFYYFHKEAMEAILATVKRDDLQSVGIVVLPTDRVTASLRRPYKKGTREPGGSSRADELTMRGVVGMGELLLKMIHEVESSIEADQRVSSQGLVEWLDRPSTIGAEIDVLGFFQDSEYGHIAGNRPRIVRAGTETIIGKWRGSTEVKLAAKLRLSPLWCYVSGLYLAEGATPKSQLFSMFRERPDNLSLEFTSSEGMSIELLVRALSNLFGNVQFHWRLKVGAQYFPELVVVGLKNAVPMLRGGAKGQGKLKTMEISLAVKNWAIDVAPFLAAYNDRYTHTEPTGSGVPRIHISMSSALCRWYFTLLMYTVFGSMVSRPASEFE